MGAGIAQVLLQAGEHVVLCEAGEPAAGAARARVARGLSRAGAGTGPLERLEACASVPDCDASLALEAVPEDVALKQRVLAAIEGHVPTDALIASNTSSLSIGALARDLARPGRFVGMHFFNPVPRSALVELVVGPATDTGTVEAARAWVRRLGKEEIVVADAPGFATSRLGVAIGLEAIRMLEEGVASAEDIDRGMVLGYRFPMGPLRLTDLVGLDVRLAIAEHLASTLGPRFD
ncbi:MAG: 3-hydroxyacyl-CoA dehydrogenase family protein, partial [Acidimicrobiales bacterium]